MNRPYPRPLSAALILSTALLAGCLDDGDGEGAIDSGPPVTMEVGEPDGEPPALTLTPDLVDRWIASAGHEAIAPLLAAISVRATQDAPAAIRTGLDEAIESPELGEAVREFEFSGAEEWALVTARIVSGMVEALERAHLDLAREMGLDEASPEYQKAVKEVEKELAAAHELLGHLSETEQKIVTDRLDDIMAAMKGDSAPNRGTEAAD